MSDSAYVKVNDSTDIREFLGLPPDEAYVGRHR